MAESTESTQEGVPERDSWKMKDEKGRGGAGTLVRLLGLTLR